MEGLKIGVGVLCEGEQGGRPSETNDEKRLNVLREED